MVQIEIENSYSKIIGLTEKQNIMLYDELSYEEESDIYLKLKNPKLQGIDLRKRLYQPKRGKFPTGLVNRVSKFLTDEGIKFTVQDNRKYPDKYHYFGMKKALPLLRYYQEELHEIIKDKKVVAASLCTGAGKSLSIMAAVKEFGVNTLILVPTLNLKDQFLADLNLYFGPKYVGTHEDEKLKPIVVANIQGIQKKDKSWFEFFEFVIIDEYHHQASDSYYDLNKKEWETIPYRLSLSATAFRNDNKDMKLEAIAGKVVYEYPAKKAIKDGFIVPPKFLLYDYKMPPLASMGFHADYKALIVNNKARNKILLDLTKKFLDKTDKNIVILCNRIEHVDLIAKEIEGSVIVTGETQHNDKVFEKYRMGKIRCIVATSQVLSEGISINNIDVLILAGGYESEIMVSQAIGRVVRLDPERNKKWAIVVDIIDKGHKIFGRHANSRYDIYLKSYGEEHIIKS